VDLRTFLHSERLFLDEPYAQGGILPKQRIEVARADIVFDNAYRTKKEKIYCHVCGGHRHNNGITGLFPDGSRILFGSACAKDFFGAEVYRLCTGDLRRRTKKASDRFLIMDVVNSVEDVEAWLRHYKPLLSHMDIAWTDIYIKYETAINGLIDNIQKNSGRLVEVSENKIGGKATKSVFVQDYKIITSISNPAAIPFLKISSQRAALVDAFIAAVKSVKQEPSEQLFTNLASMYNKTLIAAEQVDQCIAFTADFFTPSKLSSIGDWIERRRQDRLRGKGEVTPQNLKYKFEKIMGHGVEVPATSLTAALQSTGILLKLDQRKRFSQIVQKEDIVQTIS
jgi:hypothetical protein